MICQPIRYPESFLSRDVLVDPCVIPFDELSKFQIRQLLPLTNVATIDRHDNGVGDNGSQFRIYLDMRLRGIPFPNSYITRARISMTMNIVGWGLFHVGDDPNCSEIRTSDPNQPVVVAGNEATAGFYVNYQFRRRGVGSMLYKFVERACKNMGIKRLLTEPWNAVADRFFEAQGATALQDRSHWHNGLCERRIGP